MAAKDVAMVEQRPTAARGYVRMVMAGSGGQGALAHAYGSVFDNPQLITAVVIGGGRRRR